MLGNGRLDPVPQAEAWQAGAQHGRREPVPLRFSKGQGQSVGTTLCLVGTQPESANGADTPHPNRRIREWDRGLDVGEREPFWNICFFARKMTPKFWENDDHTLDC